MSTPNNPWLIYRSIKRYEFTRPKTGMLAYDLLARSEGRVMSSNVGSSYLRRF